MGTPIPYSPWVSCGGHPCGPGLTGIIAAGQGDRQAVMAVRGDSDLYHVPAVDAGSVASTLCAGCLDGYARGTPAACPRAWLFRATIFAAGENPPADGAQELLGGLRVKPRNAPVRPCVPARAR